MLEIANRPVAEVIRYLARWGLEAGYLVPTSTGLSKSIMDAHGGLREYLSAAGLHDYETQSQGPESKVVLAAWLVELDRRIPAQASLYRPQTKSGDPRIWVSGLKGYCAATDLLVLLAHERQLFVINASRPGLLASGDDPASPLGSLLVAMATQRATPAAELLCKLREIGSRGFVPSLRAGPTGVGMTLETMLGIKANSSRAPDYRGIELKASRSRKGSTARGTRITLFSKVPDWAASAVKTPVDLLHLYGYNRGGRRQLYCSLNHVPNTLGLFLEAEVDVLHASHGSVVQPVKVVQWNMSALRASLANKHQETFWVKAASRKGPHGEEFHYQEVLHTRAPLVANFKPLLELGHVEVDFVLHLMQRANGLKPRARNHGYLFKMSPGDMDLLFPPSTRYALT